MTARGRVPSTGRWDPESTLNAALADTWNDIQNQGSSLDPEDVVRAPARRGRDQSRTTTRREASTAAPSRRTSTMPRRSSQDDVDPYSVLGDPDDETSDYHTNVVDDPDDDEDEDLEDDDDTDDEDEEDEDLDEAEDITDEVDDDEEDGVNGPEGDDEDDDEEDEPVSARSRRGRDTRRQKFPKKVERQIEARVEARVKRTLEENEAFRSTQAEREKLDAQNAQFLTQTLGTNAQLQALEAVVLDPNKTEEERKEASKWLRGFKSNRQFFEQYKSGAWAVVRHQQAQADQEVMKKVSQLRALDPKVVAKGDRAATLLHAYVTGMAAAKLIADKENAALKKQIATLKGSRADRSVRRGTSSRRSGVASSAGRRANGRVASPDRLRGALVSERGLAPNSQAVFPSEKLLSDLKNGDTTLAAIGLAPTGRRRR